MKPSERIQALAVKAQQTVLAHIEQNDASFDATAATALIAALVEHLDEQHELDRRRARVQMAAHMLAIGVVTKANEYLDSAGLETRATDGADPLRTLAELVAEAEREDLL